MGTLTGMVTGKMRHKFEFPMRTPNNWNNPVILTSTPPAGFRNDGALMGGNGVIGDVGIPNPSDEVIMGAWVSFDGVLSAGSAFIGRSFDPGPPIDMTDWRSCIGIGYYQNLGKFKVWSDGVGPWVGAATLLERASASSRQFGGIWYERMQWHHVGCYFKQTGTAITCSLYIDGHQFLTYAGGSGEWLTSPDMWVCGKSMHTTSGYFSWRQDDFYVMDVTGEGDQIPPALRGIFTHVDGAGTTTQWTPKSISNWDEVDDKDIPPDDDTTYVETATSGNLDLYTHDALVAITDLPYSYDIYDAILVQTFSENVDDGEVTQIAYEHVIDVAAAQSNDGSFSNATLDTYEMYQSIFSGQPDASAWNLVDYNAAEFGYNSL